MQTVPTWINGSRGSHISTLDRGLLYGDGLFETIAVIDGKGFLLEEHLQRLLNSCERLSIPLHLPTLNEEISLFLRTCVQEQTSDRAILKLIITRGSGGRGYDITSTDNPTRILQLHNFPNYPENYSKQGVAVLLCKTPLSKNPTLAGMKHLNRLEQVLARAEWNSSEYQEGLIFDTDGLLIEGTMTNVFLIKNSKIFTPSLHESGVEGIMRNYILNLARQLEYECVIETITKKKLDDADEVFLTNSVIGIWPVRQINAQSYPTGLITNTLQKHFAKFNLTSF